MALYFSTIGAWEKEYAFEDATVNADVLNGAFGAVDNGVFTVGAKATKAIMQVEVGDDEAMPEYKIVKGSHVRVVDLTKLNGKTVQIYGYPIPESVAVGNKLASGANGALVAGAETAPYLEITKIIGNKLGVEATVVAE